MLSPALATSKERRIGRLTARPILPLRILEALGCVEINMESPADVDARGSFDARYLAFLETIVYLRPKLHRYCSRMTGSVLDGEDVVQDVLFTRRWRSCSISTWNGSTGATGTEFAN